METVKLYLVGLGDLLLAVLILLIVIDRVRLGWKLLPKHVPPPPPPTRPALPLPRMAEMDWGAKVNVAFLELDMAVRDVEARVNELEEKQ